MKWTAFHYTNRIEVTAQERGLMLLIGAALLASGVLFFFDDRAREPSLVENRSVAFDEVRIANVTFDATSASGKVNVNTATAAGLGRLPGIGEVLAGRIIAYREVHGPFASVDALAEVRGIGPETVERLREQAEVESDDQ